MAEQDVYKILAILENGDFEVEIALDKFNVPFVELGFDSLDLFMFINEVENQFGIEIDEADFEKLSCLDDVIALIKSQN